MLDKEIKFNTKQQMAQDSTQVMTAFMQHEDLEFTNESETVAGLYWALNTSTSAIGGTVLIVLFLALSSMAESNFLGGMEPSFRSPRPLSP